MYMDLSFISNYYIPIVLVGCLCVGYCIKHIVWLEKISNEYIPTMMLVLGAVLACFAEQSITLNIIVAGAVTGLASTGFHQIFKQMIEHKEK